MAEGKDKLLIEEIDTMEDVVGDGKLDDGIVRTKTASPKAKTDTMLDSDDDDVDTRYAQELSLVDSMVLEDRRKTVMRLLNDPQLNILGCYFTTKT